MRTMDIRRLVAGSLVLAGLAGPASVRGQPAPQWKVGDTWRVGTWNAQALRPDKRPKTHNVKGRMAGVLFEVTGVASVSGTECLEVQVTFAKDETNFQRRYEVYYSKDTGRLVRITDNSVRPDGTVKDVTTDYPADAQGPAFPDDVPSLVPLDWPDLARANVVVPAGEQGHTAQATVPGGVQQEEEVTLTKSSAKREAKVVQRWRRGEPWWRKASKYEDSQLVAEAVLLEVNGQKVADAPKEDVRQPQRPAR